MKKFIATSLVALFVTSCGQVNTTASGTGGGGTLMGADRGVIKDAGTTVAKIVAWLDKGGDVAVYIPSADRYASINLETGNYVSRGVDGGFTLYFAGDGCGPTPAVTSQHFVGEVGKAIIYHTASNSYYRVTASRSSYAYGSRLQSDGSCDDVDSTFTSSASSGPFDIVADSRPYDFSAIAPLTITYE